MGRPYDQIQVTGIELAQRAQQIAKQKAISFGDALYEARREMEFADTVQRNTGSPLRDQAASTTPQPSAVREAVNAGLMAVAPAWKPGGDIGAWLATSAQRDIQAGGRSVAARLQGLGLGPQITASLVAELEKFLNNLAAGEVSAANPLRLSDMIAGAALHIQQVYADALANKTDTQVWSERGFTEVQFTEAQYLSDSGYTAVDMNSIKLRDAAMQISRKRGISFGEALTMARHQVEFADDVIDPEKLSSAITSTLNEFFGALFGGTQEKIISSSDLLQAKERIEKEIRALNVGAATNAVTNAVQTALQDVTGRMALSDVDGLISKAVSAGQKAYSQAISNS